MLNLDNIIELEKQDPSGVLNSIELFTKQCRQAWEESRRIDFPQDYTKARNIVVCGMGGSRFTPKTIKELFRDRISVPYEIVEDYNLPAYVNEESLVILSSYSGSTEEILSCGKEALKRKAMMTGIMNGGIIAEFLKSNSRPVYIFEAKHNPSKQPRVGGGYLVMGHAGMLTKLGFLNLEEKEVRSSIEFVDNYALKCKADVNEDLNPAKMLSRKIYDRHPIIVTSEFLKGWANGFANQINENAKMISDYRHIPELNHHLMEGLKNPDILKKTGLFIFIESDYYHPLVFKRYKITKDVVSKQNIDNITIQLTGPSKLAQVMEAYTLSGFATFYLAMLYGVDPVSIPWVDYFKKKLS